MSFPFAVAMLVGLSPIAIAPPIGAVADAPLQFCVNEVFELVWTGPLPIGLHVPIAILAMLGADADRPNARRRPLINGVHLLGTSMKFEYPRLVETDEAMEMLLTTVAPLGLPRTRAISDAATQAPSASFQIERYVRFTMN